jgi:hypothetical protein
VYLPALLTVYLDVVPQVVDADKAFTAPFTHMGAVFVVSLHVLCQAGGKPSTTKYTNTNKENREKIL